MLAYIGYNQYFGGFVEGAKLLLFGKNTKKKKLAAIMRCSESPTTQPSPSGSKGMYPAFFIEI